MRTFFGLIAFFLLLISQGITASGYAEALPQVTAKSAIVIEAKTGEVIYARDVEEQRYPASTTKMMTLIVALEKGNLHDVVTASKAASETEGSSIWLEEGEQLTLSDLLYGMMLVSGNDATVAVAEHIAGSVEAFSELMTEKAHAIGATHTSFVNTSGLPDPRHYSTAHDLAKIAAYGYRNPLFVEIIGTNEKIIPWASKEYGRDLINENKLLRLYEGGNGVKTGYTEAAGHCLVAGAARGGLQLIAVVLDSDAMWVDTEALLNYGFTCAAMTSVLKKGELVKTVKVLSGHKELVALAVDSDVSVPVINGDTDKLKTIVDAPNQVEAGIKQGERLGIVRILHDGVEVASANLVAETDIAKKSFFARLYQVVTAGFQLIWSWMEQ